LARECINEFEMQLIIVESPRKQELSEVSGERTMNVEEQWHVKDLPKSTLGVDVEHGFAPDYIDVLSETNDKGY